MLIGPPGTGKTEITKSKFDYTEVLLLSSQIEEDIAGLVYREGSIEKRTTPQFVKRLQEKCLEHEKVCLFLDEIDKARREVVDTLLTLVTNQELFGIPSKVKIIAAANPPEWGGGDGVSIPMMNRFSIINHTIDILKFTDFIFNKYGNQNTIFINNFISKIENGEIPLLESIGEGFSMRLSSPRSFENSIKVILDNDISIEEKELIIKGMLTTNGASGLISCYIKNNDDDVQNKARKTSSSSSSIYNKLPKILPYRVK
jgi:hypothetical protein